MTPRLSGVAVVTGASSGIGRAVALELARHGTSVFITGRDPRRLESCRRDVAAIGVEVASHQADLSSDEGIRGLAAAVTSRFGRADVLVHAAGALALGNIEAAAWGDLDEAYQVNLRAPFLLTKSMLPLLRASRGQVVFVNSTAALQPGSDNGLYAATKDALRSLAGSIRDHVNPYGVRVLSVFPGRTATPMQDAVQRFEGRTRDPATLLQPGDVAEIIASALELPRTAEVTDITVRPMRKQEAGR